MGNPVPQEDIPSNVVPPEDIPHGTPGLKEHLLSLAAPGGLARITNQAQKDYEHGAYNLGGAVTDLVSNVPALRGKPAAMAGYLSNLAMQALPMMAGQETSKVATPVMESTAKTLMQSAVKPPLSALDSGDAGRAIDTMLKEGYNPTMGAVKDMNSRIGDLGTKISEALANSPESVSKAAVGQRLIDTYNKFKSQVNPQADLSALTAAWDEFKNHPDLIGKTSIPVQLAQQLKQGTYKQLNARDYGELGSAATEAQKQLARGLKETIAEKVPEISPMLNEQASLVNASQLARRRALMSSNRNLLSIAPLAASKEGALGFLADKSDLVKSMLARMLYSGSEAIPQTLGAAAGAYVGHQSGMPPDVDAQRQELVKQLRKKLGE